jgi:O-succinylbenzoic acid--CoA ligase
MVREIDFSSFENYSADDFESLEMRNMLSDLVNLAEDLSRKDCFNFQTSGSTGVPKTISFSRDEIELSAKLTASFFKLNSGAKVLLALPLHFVAGRMMLYRAVINQWKLFFTLPKLNPLIELDTQLDFAALTPQQLTTIFEQTPEKLSLVRTIICGGGRIAPGLNERILQAGTQVFETYGMTETLTHVAVRAVHLGETSFHALPGITFQLDENQCLVIRCSHLAGAPIITQDIVELISPVEMKWMGRNDFVVNSGGIKISPEKIEELLLSVFDFPFYVGSLPDDVLGQRLVIFVEEIPVCFDWQERVGNTVLMKHERPREMIAIGKFERTESGKLIRRKNAI